MTREWGTELVSPGVTWASYLEEEEEEDTEGNEWAKD